MSRTDSVCANEWWQGLFLCSGDVIEVGKGGVEWVGGNSQAARVGGLWDKSSQKPSRAESVFANEWQRCDAQMWFAPGFSDPDKYRWDSQLFEEG